MGLILCRKMKSWAIFEWNCFGKKLYIHLSYCKGCWSCIFREILFGHFWTIKLLFWH
jgi:hypothetical protein